MHVFDFIGIFGALCVSVCVCVKSCKNAQKLRANYYDIFHGSIAFNVHAVWIQNKRALACAHFFDLLLMMRTETELSEKKEKNTKKNKEYSSYAHIVLLIITPSWQPLRQQQQHTNIYWISYELCDIRFNIPIGVRIAIALLVYEASSARTKFTDANRTRHWNSKYKINCGKNVSTPLFVINASLFPVHMMLLSLTLPFSLS